MNCKPGDVAIVVGAEKGDDHTGVATRMCLGRIVRVVVLYADGVWDFEEPIELGRVAFKYGGMEASADIVMLGMHDRFLRPISGVPVHDEQHDEVTA